MEFSSNIYKYNLEVLSKLEENQTIYYEENKIFIEDRYLGRYRHGNNPRKIIEIIKISFIHFYNQLLMKLNSDLDREAILKNLNNAVVGLKKIIFDNSNFTNEETILYDTLKNDLLELLIELKEDKNDFDSDIDYDDSSDESDSETCLKSMLRNSINIEEQNFLVNTIYVVKNKLVKILFTVNNVIFDIFNF